MTTSTDGQICYGILLEEDSELPWDGEPFNGDIEDWWITAIHGFKHSFEVYNEDGTYRGGVRPDDQAMHDHWQEKFDFVKAHPIPIELFNVCSGDYPMWIIATIGKGLVANRGEPQAFDPDSFAATDQDKKALLDFCKTHGIEIGESEPKWYLSSYWR